MRGQIFGPAVLVKKNGEKYRVKGEGLDCRFIMLGRNSGSTAMKDGAKERIEKLDKNIDWFPKFEIRNDTNFSKTKVILNTLISSKI